MLGGLKTSVARSTSSRIFSCLGGWTCFSDLATAAAVADAVPSNFGSFTAQMRDHASARLGAASSGSASWALRHP
ncbi:hypothetical protein OV079_27785 [Nannocystis pusilla]|uniref:Uncharacterized protein n=1 Tax=Nannocystis pusilla TaxID=889268 RepID=A0A9X3IY95_9BACT|nr:hypothetical protein [Nannocystis pusilla]MCY1009297.1 hypothetical protein [Nannocystis pusilla]